MLLHTSFHLQNKQNSTTTEHETISLRDSQITTPSIQEEKNRI